MVKISVNGYNHEKVASEICLKSDHKNAKNSEIGPDSKTLTRNTWELVDSNFNQLSSIQALGAEALVRDVRDALPFENGGIGGGGWAPP